MDVTTVLRARGVGVGKKLKGNAQPGDVRAGRTFSNEDGNDKVGTLPVRNTAPTTITPGTTAKTLPAGIYDYDISIPGAPDLVSENIKAGANIFGVAGKPEVIDTTETTAPASAAQIRNGRKAFVNGKEVIGTLPVQATGPQTVTPGRTNIVKPAGIYDGDITIVGDSDLVSGNIRSGVNIFGVQGSSTVVDTSTGTAGPGDMLSGKKAFVNGKEVLGTIPNRGAGGTVTPGTTDQTKPAGYYSSAITIKGDPDLVSGNIRAGVNIFGVSGKSTVVDTADANLNPAYLLTGYSGYDDGVLKTGTMPNRGAPTWTPKTTNQTLAAGYYSGGTIVGDPDLVSSNIRKGINIFGVNGSLRPAAMGTVTTEREGFFDISLGFKPAAVFLQRRPSGTSSDDIVVAVYKTDGATNDVYSAFIWDKWKGYMAMRHIGTRYVAGSFNVHNTGIVCSLWYIYSGYPYDAPEHWKNVEFHYYAVSV